MDIENPKVDKCKGDYLRIKGPEKPKFYCGELKGSKLLKMGPWNKGPKKIQISFRSDNNGKRGHGVKLHLYAKKEMQEVRVAPTSSAKWPIEITGDKEDAVIAEDCRTTTG